MSNPRDTAAPTCQSSGTCQSCGKPTAQTNPCAWDKTLVVGACCENYTEDRCPDCGSDKLAYQLNGAEEDVRNYSATCEDCGYHTTDGEGDLLRVTIGPEWRPLQEWPRTLQAQLPPAPGCEPRPARKPIGTPYNYGIASIGPGLYCRTAPRKKGGRR
jgi:hypothetical protein